MLFHSKILKGNFQLNILLTIMRLSESIDFAFLLKG